MPGFMDLTGQKFGKLTVIQRMEDHVYPSGVRSKMWLCRCYCGNEVVVQGQSLRSGKTKSCGCMRTEANRGRMLDLTGQRFGKLIVLEYHGYRLTPNKKYHQWVCKCDCGSEIVVDGENLRSGMTQSCGCIKGGRPEDLIGQRFGMLTVIERAEDYAAPSGSHSIQWKCKCDCGNETIVIAHSLKNGDTRSCGCQMRSLQKVVNDLTGQRFGMLTAIKRVEDYACKSGKREIQWECQCDCGKVTKVRAYYLTNSPTKSCGCLKGCR